MAQKVQITFIDDVDGRAADETVKFALDGVAYEIDVSTGHAREMRGALAPYVSAARRVSGRSTQKAAKPTGRDHNAVRTWARANGHTVSDRGRIRADILDAYDNAH